MAFLTNSERTFLRAVANLGYCNPFLPERVTYERAVLGRDFVEAKTVWSTRVEDAESGYPNPLKITTRVERLVEQLREGLIGGVSPPQEDLSLYEDAVLFFLFHRYQTPFYEVIVRALGQKVANRRCGFYTEFRRDWERFFNLPQVTFPIRYDAPHLFACFFQIRRAFHHIFESIIGSSMVAARLRAAVWQSIFTHDMRRYRRTL